MCDHGKQLLIQQIEQARDMDPGEGDDMTEKCPDAALKLADALYEAYPKMFSHQHASAHNTSLDYCVYRDWTAHIHIDCKSPSGNSQIEIEIHHDGEYQVDIDDADAYLLDCYDPAGVVRFLIDQ